MDKTMLMDIYPVFSRSFKPGESRFDSVSAVVDHLKAKIEADPIAGYIAVFDQHAHTTSVGGTVAPELKEARNIVFCFGQQLGNAKVLAIRPRSIGVADVNGTLVVSFMAPPNDHAQAMMEQWVNGLAT